MSEYFVIKREKCTKCDEDGLIFFSNQTGTPPVEPFPMPCRPCDASGYIETRVDLLDVLAKLRWDDIRGERGYLGQYQSVDNLRIEE